MMRTRTLAWAVAAVAAFGPALPAPAAQRPPHVEDDAGDANPYSVLLGTFSPNREETNRPDLDILSVRFTTLRSGRTVTGFQVELELAAQPVAAVAAPASTRYSFGMTVACRRTTKSLTLSYDLADPATGRLQDGCTVGSPTRDVPVRVVTGGATSASSRTVVWTLALGSFPAAALVRSGTVVTPGSAYSRLRDHQFDVAAVTPPRPYRIGE